MKIMAYKKLFAGVYEIHIDERIVSMSNYHLKRYKK